MEGICKQFAERTTDRDIPLGMPPLAVIRTFSGDFHLIEYDSPCSSGSDVAVEVIAIVRPSAVTFEALLLHSTATVTDHNELLSLVESFAKRSKIPGGEPHVDFTATRQCSKGASALPVDLMEETAKAFKEITASMGICHTGAETPRFVRFHPNPVIM